MKKRLLALCLVILLALQAAGCGRIGNGKEADADGPRYQDDYYEYINKDLLDKIELDATDAHWDWFGELDAVVSAEMEEIIRELSEDDTVYERGSSEQKIKDLYECVSDTQNRNQTGLGPLKPHMDSIRNAQSIAEYVDALAMLSNEFGFSSIVGGYTVMQDKADSGQYAVYLTYADTLIGKEYVEGEDTQEYMDMYMEYVKNMLCAFGMAETDAQQSADSIQRLLREICASTLTIDQRYDPSKTYNVYTAETLQQLFTNVDVDKMLKTLRIDGQEKYIVMDVEQAKKINALLVEENLEALKDYSTFTMLNDVAQYADETFVKLQGDMRNALYGITESWEDEKIWMKLTQELLPWDFGMIYVEEHFSQEDKEEVEKIIAQILEEYEAIILKQDWMSEATKEKAIRKLETMQIKIGYPDQWPDAKDMMQVTPVSEGGSLMSNLLVSMKVSIEDMLDRLGDGVDRSEWADTPQTVNAYYDPQNNEIVFPAAILQAPFFDRENSYGAKVDGELTLMENIADLGAITCISSILRNDEEALDEAFGQMTYNWAAEDTASYMMYLISTDTHALNKVRVNAILSSCEAFYDLYDIKETDGMYVAPEERVGIWR